MPFCQPKKEVGLFCLPREKLAFLPAQRKSWPFCLPKEKLAFFPPREKQAFLSARGKFALGKVCLFVGPGKKLLFLLAQGNSWPFCPPKGIYPRMRQ